MVVDGERGPRSSDGPSCILHVGTKKTGSTALQAFLDLNRARLAARGFLYPVCAGPRHHSMLAFAASEMREGDRQAQRHGVRTEAERSALIQRFFVGLRSEIDAFGRGVVVLSSEHIHHRCRTVAELELLRDRLAEAGLCDVRVVIYLREQSEYLGSIHSERVKRGDVAAVPPSPEHEPFSLLCDYEATLGRLSDVFGGGNLVPRLYDPRDLVGGCVVKDFAHVAALGDIVDFEMPGRLNSGMSSLGIELLRRVNQLEPEFQSRRPSPERAELIRLFNRHFAGKSTVAVEIRERVRRRYRESNARVCRRWFPERDELFPDEEKISEAGALDFSDAELDALASMLRAAWRYRPRGKTAQDVRSDSGGAVSWSRAFRRLLRPLRREDDRP